MRLLAILVAGAAGGLDLPVGHRDTRGTLLPSGERAPARAVAGTGAAGPAPGASSAAAWVLSR